MVLQPPNRHLNTSLDCTTRTLLHPSPHNAMNASQFTMHAVQNYHRTQHHTHHTICYKLSTLPCRLTISPCTLHNIHLTLNTAFVLQTVQHAPLPLPPNECCLAGDSPHSSHSNRVITLTAQSTLYIMCTTHDLIVYTHTLNSSQYTEV